MDKVTIINNIVTKMTDFLSAKAMAVLVDAISCELSNVNIVDKPSTYTNNQIFDLFNKIKAPKISPKTASYYLDTVNKLIKYANKSITDITSIDIEGFLGSLAPNNSAVSLNNHRRNISAFYRWLCKQNIIDRNPCDAIEPYKEVEKPIDHMEPTEYEQLKSGCTSLKDRAIIEFLRSTAIRVGELINVKVSDMDWNNKTVRIFAPKTQNYRTAYLDDVAFKYLRDYIKSRNGSNSPDKPLFMQSRTDKPMSEESVRTTLTRIKNNAKIDRRIYPHLFRKTTATNIIKRGGSVHDAGEYLGHKDQSVTGKHYSYIGEEHTRTIFEKYVATV